MARSEEQFIVVAQNFPICYFKDNLCGSKQEKSFHAPHCKACKVAFFLVLQKGSIMNMKTAGIFSIIVGISMILMWLVFYLSGSIPELETEPARIIMHLAAEFATAIALVIGGWGLLKAKTWGKPIYLIATGALIYTMIQSPGYFIQTGEPGFVAMFAVLIIVTMVLLTRLLKSGEV